MGHICVQADAAIAALLVSEILCSTLLTLLGSVRVRETGISIAGRKGTWKAKRNMGKAGRSCHYS